MSEGADYSYDTPNKGFVERAARADVASSLEGGALPPVPFQFGFSPVNLTTTMQDLSDGGMSIPTGFYRVSGKVVLKGTGLTIAADTRLTVALGNAGSVGVGSSFDWQDGSEYVGPVTTFDGFLKSFPIAPGIANVQDSDPRTIEMKIGTALGAGSLEATVYISLEPLGPTDLNGN